MKTEPAHVPLVDVIKAIASQLIVWHHLAFYGPMSDVAYASVPGLFNWLYDQARVAVQAFLAVGGFLAGRSLFTRLERGPLDVPKLIWQRYVRLIPPYLVALAAALASGAIARALIGHPDVPKTPSFGQVLSHILLMQGILGYEGLSAGVWYVAIDFQLYAVLVFLLWMSRKLAGERARKLGLMLCAGLATASLFWFNLDPTLDVWAPYFFGAYGLGILAQRITTAPRKGAWILLLAAIVAGALAVEWRSRIAIAGLTALLLASSAGWPASWADNRLVAWLARISYSVFLIHYPVCLLVGAVVFRLWPDSVPANAAGIVLAWLASVAAGALLYRSVEARGVRLNKAA